MNTPSSLTEMVKKMHDRFGSRPHLTYKIDGEWVSKTYDETTTDMLALAEALIRKGYKNKKIMLYGGNSYEWIISDFAVSTYVGASILIDHLWNEDDVSNAISFTDAAAVFYSDSVKDHIPYCKKYNPDVEYISLEKAVPKLIKVGREIIKDKNDPFNGIPERKEGIARKLLFTSGTTGVPKVVELTQKNILAPHETLKKYLKFTENDSIFLFLPLRHVLANVDMEVWTSSIGMQLFICSDKSLIMQEIQETHPTVLVSVPLIYEKVYDNIDKKSKLLIKIILALSAPLRVFGIDIRKKAFHKVYDAFGGEMQTMITGGAPAKENILRFFNKIGMTLLNGYGATETAAAISLVPRGEVKEYASVGKPFGGISVKILAPDGEIAVKGDQIFSRYYRNPKATGNAFTKDGYYMTGDLGYLDEYGNICLTGRKKRLILTNNGENVYPAEIEAELGRSPHVHSAKVFQKDNSLVADIYLTDLKNKKEVELFVGEVNEKAPKYKRIKTWRFYSSEAKLK